MQALTVLLVFGTIYRATRLVTADSFPPIQRARDAIERRFGEDHWLPYLLSCPWCSSVWLGAVIVAVTAIVASVPVPVLVWATGSAVTGLLAQLEPEPE